MRHDPERVERYEPQDKIAVVWCGTGETASAADDGRELTFIRDTGDPEYDFVNSIPTATGEELATLEDLGKVSGGPLDGARLLLDGTRVLVRRDPPTSGDGDRVVT